jgi:E3 ubiquitin-protein ligase MARCH6
MRYFRPKKALAKVSSAIWSFLAARLRLTSYFFGGRHAEEEYTLTHWLLKSGAETSTVRDGSFRRVPAVDNIALPRDMRATVAVFEDGTPVDDAARTLMEAQNVEADKLKRKIEDDYTIVYIPPHFRYRAIVFILLLWIIGAMFVGVFVALPTQLGRSVFGLFTNDHVHDGYSFIVGFYLLWACYLVGKSIDRLDKRRQRKGGDGTRADLTVYSLKRGLLWVTKISYMILFLGIVIPTLISFVIDLYIVLPIRFTINPDMTPRIRVVDTWALGLLYSKIILHVYHLQPPNYLSTGLQNVCVSDSKICYTQDGNLDRE